MYYYLALILSILFFKPVYGIYIGKPGWYHIHMESNSHDILTINNIKYREGIFYKMLDIPIYFRFSNHYNISSFYKTHFNVDVLYKEGKKISSDCSLTDNVVIKPYDQKQICQIKYYHNKEHDIQLFGNFNFKSLYLQKSKNKNTLNIIGSNNIIFQQEMNQVSFFKQFRLKAGYHVFYLNYQNLDNNYYCNCPSISDGFKYTKLFTGIMTDITTDNDSKNYIKNTEPIKITSYQIDKKNDTNKKNSYDISIMINNTDPVVKIQNSLYNYIYSKLFSV